VIVVDPARQVVRGAVEQRVFPGATVDCGSSARSLWHEAFGTLTFASGPPSGPARAPHPVTEATAFDLASLTKVIATTTIVMDLVATGSAALDEPIAGAFAEWRGHADLRETVTVRDLLEHASGLPARLLDQPPATRREFEHDICMTPLSYAPRTQSLYSDLGFILLGMLAENRRGRPLDRQFNAIWKKGLDAESDEAAASHALLTFRPAGATKAHAAPTVPEQEDLRRGRVLTGVVHDSYAALLGGVAGHAGLFGTAAGVARFARFVLRAARGEAAPSPLTASAVAAFTTKSVVPGSSRALGWDTMLPTSSCGQCMSAAAFGHVGFTGTSLWIDPLRDRYFVLLANRTGHGGTLEEMRTVRRAFHDALRDV
jgi:CubicO group peptidase (beta-lactamase class C family)